MVEKLETSLQGYIDRGDYDESLIKRANKSIDDLNFIKDTYEMGLEGLEKGFEADKITKALGKFLK